MKAIKKPVEIEFLPFAREYHYDILEWSTEERPIEIYMPATSSKLTVAKITTLEGEYTATEGEDVIIRGVRGEVYPCKMDIFYETYDVIE